jgi:hypothetical protein
LQCCGLKNGLSAADVTFFLVIQAQSSGRDDLFERPSSYAGAHLDQLLPTLVSDQCAQSSGAVQYPNFY